MIEAKPTGNLYGVDLAHAESIQRRRDRMVCAGCGHRNVSHGHGTAAMWPEGSQIGLGDCGIDDCRCQTFETDGLIRRKDGRGTDLRSAWHS